MWVRSAALVLVWCAAAAAGQGVPAGGGADVMGARCLTCHGSELIRQQRLSRDLWARELDKMAGWGAVLEPAERDALLDELTTNFGPSAGGSAAPVAAPTSPPNGSAGASVVQARCTACHDLQLIEQQRLDANGWRREVDKMAGWGADVAPEEQEPLVTYLARRYR